MTRTVLVHLNVELPDSDTRTADELADEIVQATSYRRVLDTCTIVCPLAEDVGSHSVRVHP